MKDDNFSILLLKDVHIAKYDEVPLLSNHRDPFDRLIIATAFHERMPLISADDKFKAYKDIINLVENN